MKRFKKLMAIIMVTALIMTVAAISASAATTYTAANGTSTNFNKYLVVDSDANIPNKTFGFSVAQGTAIAATNGTVAVLAGPVLESNGSVTKPSIADVTFSPSDSTTAGTPSDNSVTTKKYATQQATVDFTGISFPEPGVYRYVITENAVSAPYSITSDNPLYLDVYVVDNNGTLAVSEYVLHEGAAAPNANSNSGTADVNDDGDELSTKSTGFTNEYSTFDLGFSKMVSGNQASKDKYFAYTVTINGLTAGDTFDVVLTDADSSISANPNNATSVITTDVTQPDSLTVAAGQTSITQVYYLQNNQSIKILGLPSGASYTVTENNEDYTQTANNDKVAVEAQGTQGQEGYVPAKTYSDTNTGTLNADKYVGYTNTKDGVIPTGVLLTIAPFAIGILLFGALIIFIIAKRRRNNY